MIDLCLLGCGGGMPMVDRYLSSALIAYEGKKILVDCGEGTQVSMKILGWGFKKIDVICITHIHGDHIVGLPGLLATIGNSGRIEPLTILGPLGIKNAINGLRAIVPYLPYEIEIIENPKEIKVLENSILIKTLELDHSSPCIGYSFNIKRKAKFDMNKALKNNVPKTLWNRLQKGGIVNLDGETYDSSLVLGQQRKGIKISYVTDTRPLDSIKEFVNESDLFICEGTYGSSLDLHKAIKNKHMTFEEAAILAKEGNVEELLLTHFSPSLINPSEFIGEIKNVFKNITIGYDRLIKSLTFTKE